MIYDFNENLDWSRGVARGTDAETIKALLSGCVSVTAASERLDRAGVDFVAMLRRGAKVFIDIKARQAGVGKYWKGEPELTLEHWSKCPADGFGGKAGWTLDEAKQTDYVLYVFDPSDTNEAFLVPFQLLRMAFRQHLNRWINRYFVGRCQTVARGGGWETESVFVPASIVLDAVSEVMRARIPEKLPF